MQKQMENGEQVSIETAPYESKFNSLYSLNVNEKVEKKNGLTYLSWAWAWAEFKKIYPTAQYRIIKNPTNNLPYFVDPEIGIVCYTEVSVDGLVYEMWLPVLDSANKAMKLEPYSYYVKESRTGKMLEKHVEKATMFDINKTIMRCLVKNLSMFAHWGKSFFVYLQIHEILESKNLNNFCNLMKIKTLLVGLTIPLTGFAQSFQVVPQELPNPDNLPALCHPVPHKRHLS